MKKLFILLLAIALNCSAQNDWTQARQEIHDNILLSASNYLAYVDPVQPLTPAPKGYEPFYLTHYGRHGSRWLISDWQYDDAIGVLTRAKENGKLTERGEKLLEQLQAFRKCADKRLGELTGVGERQHHRIGRRMVENFPEIFKAKNCKVDARSTVVIRCILSMTAECEELAKANPNMTIHNDVSESLQYYLNAPWEKRISDANKEKWNQVFDYTKAYVNPTRFWSVIINDPDYRDEKINSRTTMMKRVFDICGNMQSHFGNAADNVQESDGLSNDVLGTGLNSYSLYDLFTEDECYDLWRCKNIEWYVNYSSGISPFTQKSLLKDFEEQLTKTIQNIQVNGSSKKIAVDTKDFHGATLRFGHEVCVMPMAALLELGDTYPEVPMEGLDTLDRVWANYRIFPMASNIQLIFYRPKKGTGDILVKALLNEREVSLPIKTDNYPYYNAIDLLRYYTKKLDKFDGVVRLRGEGNGTSKN